MRVFKTKLFHKWMRSVRVTELTLKETVAEIMAGLIDASLGGSVYKKRIALSGHGKRGGARVVLAYRKNKIIFFMHGFAKNEKDNVTYEETQALKKYALFLLNLQDFGIEKALKAKELVEVKL